MEQNLVVNFDGDPVRFTPDGRLSVLDAIGALTHSESPGSLWDDVKKKHPEIRSYCSSYSFQKGHSLPVVDREGWDMLLTALVDYLGEPGFSCPGLWGGNHDVQKAQRLPPHNPAGYSHKRGSSRIHPG